MASADFLVAHHVAHDGIVTIVGRRVISLFLLSH